MNRVAIVDYGMCNLDSVRRAVEVCGAEPIVTETPAEVSRADKIILPGVGAFPDAMDRIRERSLDSALGEEVLGQEIPFLGICLGMQLLATTGFEGAETKGLDWIDADVRKLVPAGADQRVPHVGWNSVDVRTGAALFEGVPEGSDFYFVHSFHVDCRDTGDAAGTTPYCGGFVSAIERQHIFAVQFHPEKSQRNGFAVLRNFLAL